MTRKCSISKMDRIWLCIVLNNFLLIVLATVVYMIVHYSSFFQYFLLIFYFFRGFLNLRKSPKYTTAINFKRTLQFSLSHTCTQLIIIVLTKISIVSHEWILLSDSLSDMIVFILSWKFLNYVGCHCRRKLSSGLST